MVESQLNILGQMRLDVPHIRFMQSSVAADFDVLAGNIMAGLRALVVSGFQISMASAIGSQASALQLVTAGGTLMHPLASESGTFFQVPADRAVEVLSSTNTRVEGSFTAAQVNYVGIDLRRNPDDTTADLVQFLDAKTFLENPKTIPLARTLDYVIVVSTTDFGSTPGVAPLAKVTTDATNVVTAVEDARPMMFRLADGGSTPDRFRSYEWPGGRSENTTGDVFAGGDKIIGSLKDWIDAVMSRLWEIGGGTYWYSPTADRNVTMIRSGTTFTNGEYFEWDGTNLHWRGLSFVFDNSGGTVNRNTVADQLTNSGALTALADGECIYVDLDRTQNFAGLAPQKAVIATLGASTVPGARQIIAWRIGANIYTRGAYFAVGSAFAVATTTSVGMVKLQVAPGAPSAPIVFNPDVHGALTATVVTNDYDAITGTGLGGGSGLVGLGGDNQGWGVFGQGGAATGSGYTPVNAPGTGVYGVGGSGGAGVTGWGDGAGSGVVGKGGPTGIGGEFTGQGGADAVLGHGDIVATGRVFSQTRYQKTIVAGPGRWTVEANFSTLNAGVLQASAGPATAHMEIVIPVDLAGIGSATIDNIFVYITKTTAGAATMTLNSWPRAGGGATAIATNSDWTNGSVVFSLASIGHTITTGEFLTLSIILPASGDKIFGTLIEYSSNVF